MTVQRFRKKPVEIQAMQWDGTAESATPIIDWVLAEDGNTSAHWDEPHDEIRNEMPDGTVMGCPASPGGLFLHTLEGTMRADAGDWIIRGVQGEFYPCKPDIFAATYDEVKPNSTTIHVDAITDIERANLGVQQAQVGLRDSQRAVREAQQRLADVHRNG